MSFDEKYMLRAIELAKKGIGAVNPNPLVGAVIVKEGRVIGEGYHKKYGGLHAEREAFKNLTEDCSGADMYVTLEPCCHFGKQPPCTHAIVEHNIARVYVGSDDPNSLVAGKGIQYLREHGIEVVTGVRKEECDRLNPVFFHYIMEKTPYVVMKYAMTMDGKIATRTGKSKWITNEASREMVQQFRNELTGIMVGIETVRSDNPMLTCRAKGGRNPVRIICDSHLRIPLDSNIVKTARNIPVIVAALEEIRDSMKEKADALAAAGAELIFLPEKEGHIDLAALMKVLGEHQIDSILLEGGGTLNDSMMRMNLVHEIRLFLAPKIFGGRDAKTPVEGIGITEVPEAREFTVHDIEQIGDDIYIRYLKRRDSGRCLQES